jgi:hypothetical protein
MHGSSARQSRHNMLRYVKYCLLYSLTSMFVSQIFETELRQKYPDFNSYFDFFNLIFSG